jgi:NADPH:quinone reductase-like Zn-dependent oxidoreductase
MPEVLRIEEVAPSPPGEGEVRIAVKAMRKYIFDGLTSGALWPVIDRIFRPLESIVEAHRYLESNQQNGKIVVTV